MPGPSDYSTEANDDDEDFLNELVDEKKKKKKKKQPTPKKSFQEQMLEIQMSQVNALKEAEERQQAFFQKMLEEQRKLEEGEREKERNFFLELAKLFNK